jgi:hypothetical protein
VLFELAMIFRHPTQDTSSLSRADRRQSDGANPFLRPPGSPQHDRDVVIRLQHRRKISSILIRNTVVPIAIRTTLGSCLAIRASKPGVVMSIIPLDVQRRCERRWAARFSRPTESVAPRSQRSERESQQIAGSDKSKRKTHRVEAAGSAPLNLRPKWSTGTSILRPRSLEWLGRVKPI